MHVNEENTGDMKARQIIRGEISDCVDRIEATPLWRIWRDGRLSEAAYASALLQFFHLYRGLETTLAEHDPTELMRPELAFSEVLAGDLYILRTLGVRPPSLMHGTRRAADRLFPSWSESKPERMVAAAWLLEILRHRMLSLFGGTVESLHLLPGSNRGMNFIRTTLSDSGMQRVEAERHFSRCLSVARRPEQTAVGAMMFGETIARIFREIVADPWATRA